MFLSIKKITQQVFNDLCDDDVMTQQRRAELEIVEWMNGS